MFWVLSCPLILASGVGEFRIFSVEVGLVVGIIEEVTVGVKVGVNETAAAERSVQVAVTSGWVKIFP